MGKSVHHGSDQDLVLNDFIPSVEGEISRDYGRFLASPEREVIEEKFKESPFILDMMVVGEGEKFAAAIIAPDFDMLQDWCVRHDVTVNSREEMVANKVVLERFQRVIDKYNSRLGNHEQVKRFQLVTDNWTTENQFLTPTLKIKRKNIA